MDCGYLGLTLAWAEPRPCSISTALHFIFPNAGAHHQTLAINIFNTSGYSSFPQQTLGLHFLLFGRSWWQEVWMISSLMSARKNGELNYCLTPIALALAAGGFLSCHKSLSPALLHTKRLETWLGTFWRESRNFLTTLCPEQTNCWQKRSK